MNGDYSDQEKVEGVTAIYQLLNIRALAEEEMENHYAEAMRYLDNITVDEEQKSTLKELATFVKVREI